MIEIKPGQVWVVNNDYGTLSKGEKVEIVRKNEFGNWTVRGVSGWERGFNPARFIGTPTYSLNSFYSDLTFKLDESGTVKHILSHYFPEEYVQDNQ